MKYVNNNQNISEIKDSNITIGDNSFNIVNNFNINIDQRGNLKSRHDGREHEFTMFCIEEGQYLQKEKGYRKVLCTNIYSNYEFITDHCFVKFPELWYDTFCNFNLIKVKGIVYEYKRNNETQDYSIEVTEILDMSNRIQEYLKGTFGINKEPNSVESFDNILKLISNENLYDLVQEQLYLLDTTISTKCYIRQGFISGMITTRYFLNTQLLVNQQAVLRNSSREVLIDILKIVSYLIYNIDKCEIYLWRHLLKELNKMCNYFQGIKYDFIDRSKDEKQEIFDSLKEFASRINCNTHKKLHGNCKVYNRNVGYIYPKDIDEYEEKLKYSTLSYLLSKGKLELNEKA